MISNMGYDVESLRVENEQLRRAVEELSLLNDLAIEIGASSESERIIQTIVRRSIRAVNAEQGVVTLVDRLAEKRGDTFLRTGTVSSGSTEFHINESILGWIQMNRQVLVLEDPGNDPRFSGVRWEPAVRNLICVPLMVRSELIAVLTVYNKKDRSVFTPEEQRLLSIIGSQSAQILENARLSEEQKYLSRLQREMELAAEIQVDLLPKKAPRVEGYDIGGKSIPAEIVEGDYFDFFPLDENRFAFAIGDVTGKGFPASLFMAICRTLLHSESSHVISAAECLTNVNRVVCRDNEAHMFMTLFYGILDPSTGAIEYANSGHNNPYVLKRSGRVDVVGKWHDPGLGMLEGAEFHTDSLLLERGDRLLLFTDGVIESVNGNEEEFGEERLLSLLKANADLQSNELHSAIFNQVQTHLGPAPRFDDMTLVSIRRIP